MSTVKLKRKYYIFWLKTRGGFVYKTAYSFPVKATKEQVDEMLDIWYDARMKFMSRGDVASYGAREELPLPKKVLIKKFRDMNKQYRNIKTELDDLSALLNVLTVDYTK